MPAICDWTLELACRQLVAWRRRFDRRHWTMSVNVDSQHLTERGFVRRVDEVLRRTGLEPNGLILEITETAMMSTSRQTTAVLQELRDRGIGLHIDDFGTGYATLTYLHQVPARAVKIDASFVTEMLVDERHREIVRGISSLAHNLGLEVIAEGIETPPHVRALRDLGCDLQRPATDRPRVRPGEAPANGPGRVCCGAVDSSPGTGRGPQTGPKLAPVTRRSLG
ncbi:MAG: EAL domain-containing protein [bacterium]|nr:EAL domain-containing protein [bacterium]